MKKTTTISLGLIVIGVILIMISVISSKDKDETLNLSNKDYTEYTYECKNSISEINLTDSSNTINILCGNVDKPVIHYYEAEDYMEYDISENGDTLNFTRKSNKNNINFYFGIDLQDTSVTVTIPKDYKKKLSVNTTSGSIRLNDCDFSDLSVKSSSGSNSLEKINASNMIVSSSSGSIHFKEIKTSSLDSECTSGSVSFENTDAKDMTVRTTSGSIKFNTVETSSLKSSASSGSIRLNDVTADSLSASATSGVISFSNLSSDIINLKTTSGSISGDINGKEDDYSIISSTTSGSCNLDDKRTGSKELTAEATSGSIRISFSK